jgi:adenine-specific DNA-methyltransferase
LETATEPFNSHFYQDGRTATLQVEGLLGDGVFQFPKNTSVLAKLISLTTSDGDIILDFFAGSGSTAHACMELNAEEETNRKFILVQLPEKLDGNKKEQKAAFNFCKENGFEPNIAEVSKERVRRAGAKISAEKNLAKLDVGFKSFKLANSNLKAWNPDRADLEKTLLSHQEHLIDGRTEQDVLYELLIKRGIDLAVSIESRIVSGKNIYSIGYGVLLACLDESIAQADVESIAQGILKWFGELSPSSDTHVFFRDSAFCDDVAKTNMAAILEQNGITHVRSL